MRRVSEEENMSVVRQELHRQANYLRALESTNAKLTSELIVLRERQTSVDVLKEEKRGLEKRVQVLEELRTKVVRLEAEVEAGRREREEWYLLPSFNNLCKQLTLFLRANESSDLPMPSNTPISVTQSLSELRLIHARLLEEHGAITALLRQREVEIAELARQQAEAKETISFLEHNLQTHRAQIVRRETKALLAEREVGFLQALLVSVLMLYEMLPDNSFLA
jgi:mitotic spindle assembly checkpoint protein MAD1